MMQSDQRKRVQITRDCVGFVCRASYLAITLVQMELTRFFYHLAIPKKMTSFIKFFTVLKCQAIKPIESFFIEILFF